MATKVIKSNQSMVAFFSNRLNFIRGLDPLSLQNTSDSTFSLLLPGLNNVTSRIRFYSFYSWLLDHYARMAEDTNPSKQKKFIRSAEYIIALTSFFYPKPLNGIPGTEYAGKQLNEYHKTTHDIASAIYNKDQSTFKTYWQYSMGALGQYYIGSLVKMGLISRREKGDDIFVRTGKPINNHITGKKLADAFDANLTKRSKAIFFKAIENQVITNKELKKLSVDFNMAGIPFDSDEHKLLVNMLLQKDYPAYIDQHDSVSTYRRETILHLLDYAREHKTLKDREFVYHAYLIKGKNKQENSPALYGWYFYQFNEFWQYSNTAIFNGFLDYLHQTAGLNWQPLIALVQDVSEKITGIIMQLFDKQITTVKDLLDNLQADEFLFFDAINENTHLERVAAGFLLFFSQYLNNLEELFELKEYGTNNDLIKGNHEASSYFLQVFPQKFNEKLNEYFFSYLLKHIIYRHQYVAYQKIRGSNKTTQKFIIQDGKIRFIDNFDPAYTSPRIGSLIYFLEDLHMINEDEGLTAFGEQIKNFSDD